MLPLTDGNSTMVIISIVYITLSSALFLYSAQEDGYSCPVLVFFSSVGPQNKKELCSKIKS